MSEQFAPANSQLNSQANSRGYRPADPIAVPPLYRWPPRIPACARWFWHDIVFPYGIFYLGLAVATWHFLTPDPQQMETLRPGWILMIWLRNAVLLSGVAGGLHWWLYIKRRQQREFKFDPRWPATGNRVFLWSSQVKDNMFWSLASGTLVWSLYEAVTLWLYASGQVRQLAWGEAPLYLLGMTVLIFFWGTFHFYWIHRLLHWPPLYRIAHELHHRNVNIGPWSGISMHPLEHLLYFSVFTLWWVVPAHPVIVLAAGFFFGLGPAFSHSGFQQVALPWGNRQNTLPTGDYFHQLHHRYFEVNYGNTPTPLDQLFGTWHDGSDEAHARFVARRRR